MPIRINLKELFDSDSQEITIDKINFNFNKLLELGIGLPGPTGITGSIGSAGPLGPQGIQGDDGNKWFVGSNDPNGQTFIDLNDNDFYIDVDNSSIYQYDASTSTWDLLIDLETVVNNYLATSGSTFVRGLGDASPLDSRFIMFPQRGNTANDSSTDNIGSIVSNNDIFYLNNFNESVYNISNWPQENVLYDAIQKIHVDFTGGLFGRYHLELGTLYTDINGDMVLTELKHNLKLRHYVNDLQGSSEWPVNASEPINVAQFSIATTEAEPQLAIDFNSVFEFITSKFNTSGPNPANAKFITNIGAKEALGEYNTGNRHIDGIHFRYDGGTMGTIGTLGVIIGLGEDLTFPYTAPTRYLQRDYLALSQVNGGGFTRTNAILLDNETVQNKGNIEQIGSSLPREKAWDENIGDVLPANSSNTFGNSPIIAVDNQILAVNSNWQTSDASGILLTPLNTTGCTVSRYGIGGDKDSPENLERYCTGSNQTQVGYTTSYNTTTETNPTFNNNTKKLFHGTGLADMKSDGKYLYSVHNNMRGSSRVTICDPLFAARTYFQISKINNEGLQGVGHVNDYESTPPAISQDQTQGSENAWLSGAWRVEIDGNIAWVATNNLKDWGHDSNDFNPVLFPYNQFPNDSVNNFNTPGYVVPVDISNPESPFIPNGFGVLAINAGSTAGVPAHHLDMCQDSRHLYTLTLSLGTKSGGGGLPTAGYAGDGSCCINTTYDGSIIPGIGCETTPGGTAGSPIEFNGYRVNIVSYTKGCAGADPEVMPGIANLNGESTALFDNTSAPNVGINQSTNRQLQAINHFGAIDTDGTYVYAVFNNTLKIVEVASPIGIGPGDSYFSSPNAILPDVMSLFQFTDVTDILTTDCKLVGNSLYILHSGNIANDVDQYSQSVNRGMNVTKLDVKDPLNPQIIWSVPVVNDQGEALGNTARFLIVGNNIYLHQGNQTGIDDAIGGLVTIEVDGIESDHINAGIISADSVKVNDLKVDTGVEVHGSVNIGHRLSVKCAASFTDVNIAGTMSVLGSPIANASLPVGSIIPYIGIDEPTGWRRMDGQALDGALFPEFLMIAGGAGWVTSSGGGSRGGGAAVQTITLPNMTGRFLMGTNMNSFPNNSNIGHFDGNYGTSFTLTEANLPQHTHLVSGDTFGDGTHSHDIRLHQGSGGSAADRGANVNEGYTTSETAIQQAGHHSHEINLLTSSNAQSSNLQGASVSVNTPEPPHMEIVWLIKVTPGF